MTAIINGVEETDPIGTWPEAAAPDDGVSLPAAIAYVVEQQIGAIDNTTGVPTIGGVLGDFGNRSLALRLDDIATHVAGGWRLARRTYSFAVDGGAQGAKTMFTVIGTVFVMPFGVCQTNLDSGGAATVELGIVGNTACFIAQTTATGLDQYEIWQDATPDANGSAVNIYAVLGHVATNGADINLTIGSADLTAGVIDFYCFWAPLSADGLVVAA